MIRSEAFISPAKNHRGIGQLEVHPHDTPLVAHFSGNDPEVMLASLLDGTSEINRVGKVRSGGELSMEI